MASTSSSDDRHSVNWFPSWFIWPLFFVTSALRVHYVIQPRNWWILHPDEIHQTMEVAHSEVYGYGFRAYEFNPPPVIGPDTPDIRKQELEHGMFALRSYLLPYTYVTVTWFLRLLGLEFMPFLTWKIAHTLVASTLLLAVYRYVNAVFRSHDVACLAAILCASCSQLHVFGTHTLVNSLLAPLVFWALAHIHSLISPPPPSELNNKAAVYNDKESAKNKSPTVNGSARNQHSPLHKNQVSRGKEKQKQHRNGITQKRNFASSSKNGIGRHDFTLHNDQTNGSHTKRNLTVTNNGLTTSSSPMNGHTNGISPSMNGQESLVHRNGTSHHVSTELSPKTTCSVHLRNLARNLAAGFVLGVCVYIRIDITGFAVASLLPHWSPFRTRYVDVILSACGAVCGMAVGVFEDFRIYGWGILTPYQWYRFNVAKDYSSRLFGSDPPLQYIEDIFFHNLGMIVLTAASLLCCVSRFSSFRHTFKKEEVTDLTKSNSNGLNTTGRVCVSWVMLLALYSSKGHKELRFVHNVIVLILVTWAALLQSAVRRLLSSREQQCRAMAVGVVLFILSQWQDVASLTGNPTRGGNKMAFKSAGDTQDVNQCLHYVSTRDDVTGIFLDRNLYATGGYTLLHKNVSVFSVFGKSFNEYRVEDRLEEPAKTSIGPHTNISLAYVAKYSNFVTLQHSPLAIRFVLADKRYNYLIMMAMHNFQTFGLGNPVFTCGTFKVYQRPRKPTPEQKQLLQRALDAPVQFNVTVLLHEADMLFYYGLRSRAVERFHLALQVDPNEIGAYLPLASLYHQRGKTQEAFDILNRCYEKFGQEKCEMKRDLMTSLSCGYD